MRKTGWAAAAGFGSLVLLLAACGGSSSSSSGSTPTSTTTAQAAGQPSSVAGASLPQPGSTVLSVQKWAVGYVPPQANGQPVHTCGKDTKGVEPMCTGSCASIWLPVPGKPVPSPADTLPGTLGTVSDANRSEEHTSELQSRQYLV